MKINSAAEFGRLSVEVMIEAIKLQIKKKGITNKEFAEKCGMLPWVLSNILNQHKDPAAEQLVIMYSMAFDDVYNSMIKAINSMDELKRMEFTGK